MSHPFKTGDKVVRLPEHRNGLWSKGDAVATVTWAGYSDGRYCVRVDVILGTFVAARFRAAVAGQDYDVPAERNDVYQGHLPDGSSVQAHSAGGLYPVVLTYRDKAGGPNADGKYDVGVISPKNQDPIWFKSSDAAIAVAEAIKANL